MISQILSRRLSFGEVCLNAQEVLLSSLEMIPISCILWQSLKLLPQEILLDI